ncbi:PepSY-associated TM helix domain-containing protein [Noviherbaspirillum sp. CPCC 100848]|uniref:PepSY-associated TM helix domain-containing protein n=1 Tax=Noviherbaspirillum album TaxID=3080276 RepID=A0ABU6JC95_9BURK|nr:PepSY-associated TM helix domain-containing protein [Noviherbaspirillum sp. CPCC 100848]MEC4721252.1 PepSY-associated TM helix domain-containing protein [Noviherbaspirillum sp. CPCC 100848]
MRDGFRQSIAWLHTWSGLLVCWVLLLIFMAGTSSYYRDEITFWMKPELHASAAAPAPGVAAASHAVRILQERAPGATRWIIDLPDGRSPILNLNWTMPPVKGQTPAERRAAFRRQSIALDPATGAEIQRPRETRGGEFLYRLHFDLYYMPAIWGRWIVGFCAMFMLVAIISGVITHKRIFKDFFTFRPRKGQRSWLDAHNATAVLALPFHLMITYTGLVTLMFMYMPLPGKLLYNGDDKALLAEVFPNNERGKPARVAAPMADIAPMVEQAVRKWSVDPARIFINHPGDANATVHFIRPSGTQLSNTEPSMVFNAATGALISADEEVSRASAARRGFYGLHLAHFADPLLRALFFLCGLAGCAMVATGALLWAVKERQKSAKAVANGGRPGFGVRLVDSLNIGAIAGLPIALGAYFWGNRLLPLTLEARTDAEASCFFAAWGISALLAQVSPTRRMWQIQLAAGGLLLGGIPLINALTTDFHLGVTLFGAPGLRPVAAFDLVAMGLGLMLAYAARVVGQKKNMLSTKRRAPAPRDAETRAAELSA